MKYLIDDSEVLEDKIVRIDEYGRAFVSTKLKGQRVRILVLKVEE